jgi:hypothetical protein
MFKELLLERHPDDMTMHLGIMKFLKKKYKTKNQFVRYELDDNELKKADKIKYKDDYFGDVMLYVIPDYMPGMPVYDYEVL